MFPRVVFYEMEVTWSGGSLRDGDLQMKRHGLCTNYEMRENELRMKQTGKVPNQQ